MSAKSIFISSELIQCPVCKEFPDKAPIYQCINGHITCSLCRPKLNQCPVCRTKWSQTRNLLAEQILAANLWNHPHGRPTTTIPCKFLEFGCKKSFEKIILANHERNCEFRTIKCPDCSLPISLNEITGHLNKRHSIVIYPLEEKSKTSFQIRCSQIKEIGFFSKPGINWLNIISVFSPLASAQFQKINIDDIDFITGVFNYLDTYESISMFLLVICKSPPEIAYHYNFSLTVTLPDNSTFSIERPVECTFETDFNKTARLGEIVIPKSGKRFKPEEIVATVNVWKLK
jgi:hypothetical protein